MRLAHIDDLTEISGAHFNIGTSFGYVPGVINAGCQWHPASCSILFDHGLDTVLVCDVTDLSIGLWCQLHDKLQSLYWPGSWLISLKTIVVPASSVGFGNSKSNSIRSAGDESNFSFTEKTVFNWEWCVCHLML